MMVSWAWLRPWMELVRLPALFSAWSNIIAAHLVATDGALDARMLAVQLGITTCLYWAGMILNDCFDLAEDRRERPNRPLPSGRIRPTSAWLAGGALLLVGLILGAAAGLVPLLVSGLLGLAVVAYDAWLKHRQSGPLAMGLCRYLNWLLGLSAAPILLPSLLLPLPILLYTVAVTVLSCAETRDGDRRAVLHSALWVGTAFIAMLGLFVLGLFSDLLALLALALALALLLRFLAGVGREARAGDVRKAVGLMLLGMIPLDALFLAGNGQWPAALGLLLFLVPGRLLARRIGVT
jgi:4-hydroxybenzoate polyprenyltransferase